MLQNGKARKGETFTEITEHLIRLAPERQRFDSLIIYGKVVFLILLVWRS